MNNQEGKTTKVMLQNRCAMIFSICMIIGIVTCVICDIAINHYFTWSLLTTSSIIFAGIVLFPVIRYWENGIVYTILMLNIFCIPFLYVLDYLIKINDNIFPIGLRMSVISFVYIWVVYVLIKTLKNKLLAISISLLLEIPMCILINFTLSKIISEPLIDIWDVVCTSIILTIVMILYYISKKNKNITKK